MPKYSALWSLQTESFNVTSDWGDSLGLAVAGGTRFWRHQESSPESSFRNLLHAISSSFLTLPLGEITGVAVTGPLMKFQIEEGEFLSGRGNLEMAVGRSLRCEGSNNTLNRMVMVVMSLYQTLVKLWKELICMCWSSKLTELKRWLSDSIRI